MQVFSVTAASVRKIHSGTRPDQQEKCLPASGEMGSPYKEKSVYDEGKQALYRLPQHLTASGWWGSRRMWELKCLSHSNCWVSHPCRFQKPHISPPFSLFCYECRSLTIPPVNLVTYLDGRVYLTSLVFWDSKHMSYPFQDKWRPRAISSKVSSWNVGIVIQMPCSLPTVLWRGDIWSHHQHPFHWPLAASQAVPPCVGWQESPALGRHGEKCCGRKGWRTRCWQGLCSYWTPPNPEFSKRRYKMH